MCDSVGVDKTESKHPKPIKLLILAPVEFYWLKTKNKVVIFQSENVDIIIIFNS